LVRDPAEDETDRLRRVYDGYASDAATQARWDPTDPGNRLMLAERDDLLVGALARITSTAPDRPGPATLVELGCGDGRVLVAALGGDPGAWSAIGIDLLEARVRRAREAHAGLALVVANGTALPLPDDSVDVMVAFTLFSSILDQGMARSVAAEMARTMRGGGSVVWYDLRRDNPRNAEVRGMTRDDIAALFPGWSMQLRTCTVLPPLARRVARVAPGAYGLLAKVPALRSHQFGVLRAPVAQGR
jgi:ubiquinone/menaquinone biosynthesis C-methylase UbiE